MRLIHLDCASGLGGDMLLAALADLGLDLAPLQDIFRRAGIDVAVIAAEKRSRGVLGRHLDISFPVAQPLRHLHDLTDIVGRLDLPDTVKARSVDGLTRLAEAEAFVHGCPLEHVHFHEVGAVDTLVDVVGAFWAVEALGAARVTATALPWFRGTVRCDHGVMPLPAPATARLLQGKPVYPTDIEREIITPTGALLIDRLVSDFVPGPTGRLLAVGTGFGTMDIPGHFNGLRAYLCEADAAPEMETIRVLESNIDHLTGEEVGSALDALLGAGALDAVWLPAIMKKSRPGGILQTLCREEDLPRVREAFFRHTLTLGIRQTRTERAVLPRRSATLKTPYGDLEAKETELDGTHFRRPEYEALQALARKTGRSVAELRYLLGAGEE